MRAILYTLLSILITISSIYPKNQINSLGIKLIKDKIQLINQYRADLLANYNEKNKNKIALKLKKETLNIIDITEISRLVLGKHYNAITSKQKKKFIELFEEILTRRITQSSLPNKASLKKILPIEIKSEVLQPDTIFKKEAITVYSEVKNSEMIYDVNFYLYKEGKKLILYDIYIDDASLLLDFKNQFSIMIKKEGFSNFLNKIENKLFPSKESTKK